MASLSRDALHMCIAFQLSGNTLLTECFFRSALLSAGCVLDGYFNPITNKDNREWLIEMFPHVPKLLDFLMYFRHDYAAHARIYDTNGKQTQNDEKQPKHKVSGEEEQLGKQYGRKFDSTSNCVFSFNHDIAVYIVLFSEL